MIKRATFSEEEAYGRKCVERNGYELVLDFSWMQEVISMGFFKCSGS